MCIRDRFALDAFKVNAIDYLVKPVETERLSQAISRVREHVSLHVQAQKSERIPVEKGGKKILIGIDKIRFVMARDDYAYLQTDTDRYFSTVSLAQLEKRLDGHGFFRVHRGYPVSYTHLDVYKRQDAAWAASMSESVTASPTPRSRGT